MSFQWWRGRHGLGFILVLVLNTAVFYLIAYQIIAFQQYPFDADEANHAIGALRMTLALRARDLHSFSHELLAQSFYPPGVSWIKALLFWGLGSSTVIARLFSAVCFFLAVLLIYFICLAVDRRYGWLSGVIAAFLTLTMHSLLVTSALVMLEAPGLLISLGALYLYMLELKRPRRPFSRSVLLAVSLSLILIFLTKYSYGAVVLLTVGLVELSWIFAESKKTKQWWRYVSARLIWLFGPFSFGILFWMVKSRSLASLLDYAQPLAPGEPWLSTSGIRFYPISLALHDTPSPLFALISAAGLAWTILRWRNLSLRLWSLYFLIGMGVIMLVNHPPNYRFIATFVPSLHILTSLMLTDGVDLIKNRWPQTGVVQRLMLAVGFMLFISASIQSVSVLRTRIGQYASVMEVEYETHPTINDISGWIQSVIPLSERYFVLNYWDQLSPEAIAWQEGSNRSIALSLPSMILSAPTPQNLAQFQHKLNLSDVAYIVLFEGGPWGNSAWPDYTEIIEINYDVMTRNQFEVTFIDVGNWLDTTLLTMPEWEQVKEDRRATLNINVIIYRRGAVP